MTVDVHDLVRRRTVTADGRMATRTLVDERGRRGDLRYGGPRADGPDVELPPDEGSERVETALARLVAAAPLRLHWTSVTGTRSVRTAAGWRTRRLDAWALTGSLPVGWSGRGDGTAFLDRRAAAEIGDLRARTAAAGPTPAGVHAVVLAPAAAAVLLHETAGHLLEGGGPVGRIASDAVTLYDDPGAEGGVARFAVDDDGVPATARTPLVRAGVVVGRLHSVASAAAAGALPTGNARCASAWDVPLARMSNLVCRPGAATTAGLLAGIGRGLLVHRLANGVSDGLRVAADVVLAEVVADGVPTGAFTTGGRVDDRADLLLRVDEAGDAPAFAGNAMCGRAGQVLLDVGTCAPALRLSALRLAA